MSLELKIRNIVFAGGFNSVAFDKYFFIKNNIIQESELKENSFVTDGMVTQLTTKIFQIVVTPIQIVLNVINPSGSDKLEDIATKIIEEGNISQLTGIGFNFNWNLNDDGKNIQELSKQHFYSKEIKILDLYFNKPDAKFGIYSSINFEDARLKLDIKPISTTRILLRENRTEVSEAIQFQFNFHFEIPKDTKSLDCIKYLKDYNKYKEFSTEIMNNYK